jgi:hypothetical protein
MATSSGENSSIPTNRVSGFADEALANVSEIARETGAKAKRAAFDAASSATDQVKDLIDRQLSGGVQFAGEFANAVRQSTSGLQDKSPFLAGAVEILADKIDEYTEGLEDQTVDHLYRTAADFTRRQPAVVFGLAALAGFFVYRAVKAASPIEAPSIQPDGSSGPNRYEG